MTRNYATAKNGESRNGDESLRRGRDDNPPPDDGKSFAKGVAV